MDIDYRVFYTGEEAAEAIAEELIEEISKAPGKSYNIALAGGSTPNKLYSILGRELDTYTAFKKVNFYWGDERCVPPEHEQSNYGAAQIHLFGMIKSDQERVFRMMGEANIDEEVKRYSNLLAEKLPMVDKIPQFDLILLGIGEDGHTASIFPNQSELLTTESFVAKATHPESGQARITLTGKIINNARKVIFMANGKNKATIVNEIFNNKGNCKNYPAYHIKAEKGEVEWFLDEKAASLL